MTDKTGYKYGGDFAFYVYRNGTQSISPLTHTVIQFNANYLDECNTCFSTTGYKITATKSGVYLFIGQVRNDTQIEYGDVFYMYITKNGGAIALDYREAPCDSYQTCNVQILSYLDVGDYVQATVYHGYDGNINIMSGQNRTFFMGVKLN